MSTERASQVNVINERKYMEARIITAKECGIETIDLPFHVTESAGRCRGDNRLYFFEGFAVPSKGFEKRQCND